MKKLLTIFIVMLSISANAKDNEITLKALNQKVTTLENRVEKIEEAIIPQRRFQNTTTVSSIKPIKEFLKFRAINLWVNDVSDNENIPKFYNVIKACFETFEAENPKYPNETYSIENIRLNDTKYKNSYDAGITGNKWHLELFRGATAQECYNWLNDIVLNEQDL